MQPDRLDLDVCTVWLTARRVERGSQTLRLSAREASLLRYLAVHHDRVVGRDELLREVWRYRKGAVTRAVDHAVARVRKKIERDPAEPDHLHSEYGEGYRFHVGTSAPITAALVGRTAEAERALQALDTGARLVTLTGPGGVGKTSLAAALIARLASRGRSVWRLQGPFADAGDLSAAARRAGDLHVASDVAVALASLRRPLLWIDEPGAVARVRPLLRMWLQGAPGLQIVLSGREVVGAPEEVRVVLGGLPKAEAHALFMALAEASSPGVSERTDPAVVDALMDQLDGLPLAIELCAARCSLLDPRSLLERMGDRFALLDHGGRGLRATIDASWRALTDVERAALVAVATFEGGFDVRVAEAVVGSHALDRLQALRDKSLLRLQRGGLLLLDTLRAFVRERVGDTELWDRARDRHAQVLADSVLAGERVATDDLRAAVRWTIGRGEPDVLAALAPPLLARLGANHQHRDAAAFARDLMALPLPMHAKVPIWRAVAGPLERASAWEEAIAALEWVAEHGDPPDSVTVRGRLAWLLHSSGETSRARAVVEEGIADARAGSLRVPEARLMQVLGTMSSDLDEAELRLEAAVEIFRHEDRPGLLANALSDQGVLLSQRGQGGHALRAFSEALVLHRSQGNRFQEANALARVGCAREVLDDLPGAERDLTEALERLRPLALADAEAVVHGNLGLVWVASGRRDAARKSFERARDAYLRTGNQLMLAIDQGNLGVWHLEGTPPDLDAAEPLLRHAVEQLEAAELTQACGWFRGALAEARVRQGHLDQGRGLFDRAESELESVNAHVGVAQVVVRRGQVALDRGDSAAAAVWAARARALLTDRSASAGRWRSLRKLERLLS